MAEAPSSIYEHTEPESTLLPHLRSFLPFCIPLYRRLQFGKRSEHARILATFAAGSTASAAPQNEPGKPQSACIGAAYVDRSRRPETEAWIFLSHDSPLHGCTGGDDTCACPTLLLALLQHVSTLPYPPLSTEDEADVFAAVNNANPSAPQHNHTSTAAAAYLEHLHPAVLTAGALHVRNVLELRARGYVREDMPGARSPYRKYIFAPSSSSAAVAASTVSTPSGAASPAVKTSGSLPYGLRWGTVREQDLDLVRSRTAIPRTHRTLRTLVSMAAFPVSPPDASPVAWAFLGPDGSLSSLHVEPEFRGRGIAKAVAGKLFRDGMGVFGDELDGLAHADVALENMESNGVCRGLGGTEGWEVYWVRIDLDRVSAVVGAN